MVPTTHSAKALRTQVAMAASVKSESETLIMEPRHRIGSASKNWLLKHAEADH